MQQRHYKVLNPVEENAACTYLRKNPGGPILVRVNADVFHCIMIGAGAWLLIPTRKVEGAHLLSLQLLSLRLGFSVAASKETSPQRRSLMPRPLVQKTLGAAVEWWACRCTRHLPHRPADNGTIPLCGRDTDSLSRA